MYLKGPKPCETALAGWVLVIFFSVEVPEKGTDGAVMGPSPSSTIEVSGKNQTSVVILLSFQGGYTAI